jgi:4-hydroxybenzoate polyprenyltransferase
MTTIQRFAKLVKFEHTLFAMPFALTGFFMAVDQPGVSVNVKLLLLVVLCMIFARNAAMGFNRWLDRRFDLLNPRTSGREIPAGIISPGSALAFVIINSLLFISTTWFINPLCFKLSPVALFILLFYSYTKRITELSHFVLSLGLAIAPVGAYLAVTARFGWQPVLLGTVVLFWVSGFDIIYALQDEDFDKNNRLKSIPARFGKARALWLSGIIHTISAALAILLAIRMKGGFLHWAGVAVFTVLLIYQHSIVKPHDLRRVNTAFFTTNGIASVLYAALVIPDILLSSPLLP